MGIWLIVWFLVGILTTATVIAFLLALIRHLLVLGRTARRMQEELSPIVQQISTEGGRASERASRLGARR
ncbi:MAG: hypothetical protein OEV60_10800 [Actinomycetota bacterium]|nr:hypothetical protein [Actinomycetota bacterium]MDH5223605.1 hypothetical protein [Actinomycetota bacterium]MDH5313257.1 hypothetical protein [Actinomycetota bacterium]